MTTSPLLLGIRKGLRFFFPPGRFGYLCFIQYHFLLSDFISTTYCRNFEKHVVGEKKAFFLIPIPRQEVFLRKKVEIWPRLLLMCTEDIQRGMWGDW